ncbi:MAG: DUF4097 family beta strand repeat protein [Myxococcales bacterium]|nr:DUF4097 family beta strand repeat protein [Myxococcales bacterium]
MSSTRRLSIVVAVLTLLTGGCTRVVLKREVRISRQLTPGQTIRIALQSAALTVVGSLGNEIVVTGELRVTASTDSEAETMLRTIHVRTRVVGSQLIVEQVGPRQSITRHASLKLTVSLPATRSLAIVIDTGDVDGRQLRGPCRLTTQNGRLTLASSQPTRLSIENRNGAVVLRQVSTPTARIALTNGQLTLDRFSGSLDARVKTGSVSGSLLALSGVGNRIRVGSGSIHLSLTSRRDLQVTATVVSGRVESSLPSSGPPKSKALRFGKGTSRLELHAESGSIRLTP